MKRIYVLLLGILALLTIIIAMTQNVFTETAIYKEPASLNIREVDVKPIEITSSFVNINITTYINHRGGETNNASILIRAIDSNTGLLNSQIYAYIPKTEKEDIEKILIVSQNLKIDRNGNYDLNLLLFDNNSLLDSGSISIRGINILTPQSKKSYIGINNIDFFVGGVSTGKVNIKPQIYLENTGPAPSENLRLIVKAREADSNILADETNTDTGIIGNEKTVVKEVQLNVPDEYNYMVIVELWKNDTLINTWEKPILLAPTKAIPKESQEKKVNIEVSKFVREGQVQMPGVTTPPYAPVHAEATPTPKEPGFETIGAIFAILMVLIIRRKSQW